MKRADWGVRAFALICSWALLGFASCATEEEELPANTAADSSAPDAAEGSDGGGIDGPSDATARDAAEGSDSGGIDGPSDVAGPDASDVVMLPIDRERTLNTYAIGGLVAAVTASDETATCAPAQIAMGTTSECVTTADCSGNEVCRDRVVYALDSQCTCVPNDNPCEPGMLSEATVCLPGASGPNGLCGPGWPCTNTVYPGTCFADSDCPADEMCIIAVNECFELLGTTCTPRAGTGCLLSGECPVDFPCIPSSGGDFRCVERDICY